MNEATFSRRLANQLRAEGAFVQRIETSTGAGVPDMFVIHKGRSCWLETKFNTTLLRPMQAAWRCRLLQAGGTYFVACYLQGTKPGSKCRMQVQGFTADRFVCWNYTVTDNPATDITAYLHAP